MKNIILNYDVIISGGITCRLRPLRVRQLRASIYTGLQFFGWYGVYNTLIARSFCF